MTRLRNTLRLGAALAAILPLFGMAEPPTADRPDDKLTYHQDAARTGWNAHERILTPDAVAGHGFGLVWRSPRLHGLGGLPPRLFATPLYAGGLDIATETQRGRHDVVFAATNIGFVYAVNASQATALPAGEILWSARLTPRPCLSIGGNLSTPVIDRAANRIYVTACDVQAGWQAHALDLSSGRTLPGWPVTLNAETLNRPGVNRNGTTRYPDNPLIQRGALNLSPDGARLYVAFGGDEASGWLVSVDTRSPGIASAFSTTPVTSETQGGMWSSGGPALDAQGRVSIATGASILNTQRNGGVAGVFPDTPGDWGQSILQFRDGVEGLTLAGTYTPFNYCQAQSMDIDLGSSGTFVIDLPSSRTSTPRLLGLAGAKQGVAYLLDRDALPGSRVKRPACSQDPATDGSLLAPDPQPQFGKPGPLSVFAPYSETHGMVDQAKSRSTAAQYRDARGATYLFVSGSSKRPDNLSVSVPPGLVRLKVVAAPGRPAYLAMDRQQTTETLHNPGSPVVTSRGARGAIVWVLDTDAPRSAPLYGPKAPRPVLYAFDARDLTLLWKSAPGLLGTGGKYNEPTIAKGLVFVGTDRIEAFGLRPAGGAAREPDTRSLGDVQFAALPARQTVSAEKAQQLFQARCAVCHGSGQPNIPTLAALARTPPSRIVQALTTGPMRAQAVGLTEAEIAGLASYLSALPH